MSSDRKIYRGPRSGLLFLSFGRVTRKFVRRPAAIAFSLAQPIVWMLLIGYVLDDAGLEAPTGRYLSFFLPTAVAMTIAYAGFQGGVGTALEIEGGFGLRLALLGADPRTVLLGRWLSDAAKAAVQVALLVAMGMGLGARLQLEVAGLLTALLACAGLMALWLAVSNWIAVRTSDSELTLGASLVLVPTGLLLSEALVPAERLPETVRLLASLNPAAWGLAALRSGFDGSPDAGSVVAGCALLLVGSGGLLATARAPQLGGGAAGAP